jgi:hypothetical protein
LNKIETSTIQSNTKPVKEIFITRHSFTNVNLYKKQFNPFSISKISDKDTKLSLYGILSALNFNNTSNNSIINLENCDETVFVSVLIKTWLTAICLYLPQIENNKSEFKLVVAPFIKEQGNKLESNPISLAKQIIIIKNFLKFIRNNFNDSFRQEIYYKNGNKIKKFFDKSNNKLSIYCVKKSKIGTIKYVKYEIHYDGICYTSSSKIENYFDSLKKINIKNYPNTLNKLYIENLSILPGVRKPNSIMINKYIKSKNIEPLTENKVETNFKNCISTINIGIIDIDENGKKFDKINIEDFYKKNFKLFNNSNILLVCSQRSISLGTTSHFQHLLKEVIEESTKTNFNFKNSNKKNSSQVFKSFSQISTPMGLRTRVYTQGLDNDKLNVDFNSINFNLISSTEGAILCNINYDGNELIKVLNLYADVKNHEDRQNIINVKKKNNIARKISEKFGKSENNKKNGKIYSVGKKFIIFEDIINNNISVVYNKFNNNLELLSSSF